MLDTPVDFFGDQINVGDVIVYPGRMSSSMWVNCAKVLEICTYKPYWSRSEKKYFSLKCARWNPVTDSYSGKPVKITKIENVVIKRRSE